MTNKEKALEVLEELSKLLTERISELHKRPMWQQARHAYIFYRDKVFEIEEIVRKLK